MLADLCGHAILAGRYFPPDTPCHAKCRQESPIEHFFGRVKTTSAGQCTIKDAIYGCWTEHARQLKQSGMWETFQGKCKDPIGEDALSEMGQKALQQACTFQVPGKLISIKFVCFIFVTLSIPYPFLSYFILFLFMLTPDGV